MLYGAGSSDPRVRFKVTGTRTLVVRRSASRKVWTRRARDLFITPHKKLLGGEKPIDFGVNGPILEVRARTSMPSRPADFMGELNLPVGVRRPSFLCAALYAIDATA